MKPPRKPISPLRQTLRIMAFCALGVVATMRWLMPPERVQFNGGWAAFGERGERGRFRRGPTRVQKPVAPIPADLWRVEIELDSKEYAELEDYTWGGWNGNRQVRPEVRATVREGGVVYHDVALHLKGAAGSFRRINDKPALTLNFSKHVDGQKFHGYSKISLNNSVQDPSYLTEIICRELFEAAGVPAPKADHATVLINGVDWDLYVMTEGWGKPFLKRYFKNVSGNLYDSGFVQDVTGDLSVNSGDKREDRSDLAALIEAASEPNAATRWEKLNHVLDMDRFISFAAMEIMTCHWDGYCLNRNNYRVFHDAETGKMVFMPHGMDQMFGVVRSSPTAPIRPPMQGLVARAVSTTPQGRRLLIERISNLRTNVFDERRITGRVRELAAKIRPTLEAYHPDRARAHDNEVEELCARIEERARSITEQLGASSEPIVFSGSGVARLKGWSSRVTSGDRSGFSFTRTEREGRNILVIATNGRGGGSGSWRMRAPLDPGEYRLEGRVKTSGLGSREGVRMRISGARVQLQDPPDGEWIPISFTFSVGDTSDVELVCELTASEGEAWFDEDSLHLIRD